MKLEASFRCGPLAQHWELRARWTWLTCESKGVVRLLVDVIDSNKIPEDTVNGCLYPIYFKVDEVVSTGDDSFDDDDLLDKDDAQGETHGEDHTMMDATQSDHTESKDSTRDAGEQTGGKQDTTQNVVSLAKEKELVEEIVDKVADVRLDKISRVLATEPKDTMDGSLITSTLLSRCMEEGKKGRRSVEP
jgi:hypothetical protein